MVLVISLILKKQMKQIHWSTKHQFPLTKPTIDDPIDNPNLWKEGVRNPGSYTCIQLM